MLPSKAADFAVDVVNIGKLLKLLPQIHLAFSSAIRAGSSIFVPALPLSTSALYLQIELGSVWLMLDLMAISALQA